MSSKFTAAWREMLDAGAYSYFPGCLPAPPVRAPDISLFGVSVFCAPLGFEFHFSGKRRFPGNEVKEKDPNR